MCIIIRSLTEFENAIESEIQRNDWSLFRGQANSKWDIVSSAYRAIHAKYPALDIDINLLDTYSQNIPNEVKYLYGNIINTSYDDDEILCMLQHLGGKSTYIDLSKNYLIALYFACDQQQDKEDGMVYLFKSEGDSVIGKQGCAIGHLIEVDIDKNNTAYPRLEAQKSCFLYPTISPVIGKEETDCIIIDKWCKNKILEELKEKHGICHESIYPDILDFIQHQGDFDNYIESFTAIVLRNISQTIKNACVRDIDDAFLTLDAIENRRSLSEEDKNRVKYLKILGLLCVQKYDKALNLLDTFENPYYYFKPYNNVVLNESKDYDPIPVLFIAEFEKAKCYMGLKKYTMAINHYDTANAIIMSLPQDIKEKSQGEINDFWKSYAKALVRVDVCNLSIAMDVMQNANKTETDVCELYMIVEDWNTAIQRLKNVINSRDENDYAYVLLGNCYMALAKKGGNKRLHIEKAISYYDKAIAFQRAADRYVADTELHDHYYKRAMAYRELGKFNEAAEDYKTIIEAPYKNEDAMHDLAYMNHKRALITNERITSNALNEYFFAIHNSRLEKQARNFNDIGRLVLDMYYEKLGCGDDEIEILGSNISQIKANSGKYPEVVQSKLRELEPPETVKDNKKYLLMVAESFFTVANLIYNRDAFANKKLGDVYYEYYCISDSKESRMEYALHALRAYYLSQGFYLAENKRCNEMEQRIKELENILNCDIQYVNDDK